MMKVDPCQEWQGFLIRGTYIVINFIKVFVEHFNKMNDMHHIGAHLTPWGVSNFKKFGPSGHRPLISFIKKFLI